MVPFRARLFGAVCRIDPCGGRPALSQQLELKLMAPAALAADGIRRPRNAASPVAAGIARSVQVTNVAGAGAAWASRSSSRQRW